jgi:hypothetical protein
LYATHQDRLSADLLRLVAASAAPTTSRRAS